MTGVFIQETEVHPAAQMFPEMTDAEIVALSESIRRNGIQKALVFHHGKLVDGRNRMRAGIVAGVPFAKMPKNHLPEDADPYLFAWMANCERLDYSPSKKAELRQHIEEESGRLQAMRKEAEEAKKEKGRLAAQRKHAKPTQAEVGVRHVADTHKPPEPEPKANRRKDAVAAKMAAAAGVSQRTMERVMSKARQGGGASRLKKATPKHGETWRVPRDIRLMATFLRQRLPSDEIAQLIRLLTKAEEVP